MTEINWKTDESKGKTEMPWVWITSILELEL